MVFHLEKPREDFIELIIHVRAPCEKPCQDGSDFLSLSQHVITLWLVGASYCYNLTQIGIAVFVSMYADMRPFSASFADVAPL